MDAGVNTKTKSSGKRFQSLDILRGAVMVLMAVDHVRVYSGIPSGSFSPDFFFTRWVTHFCAPSFVFFAGVSAFLYGNKINDRKKLATFLLTRGLMLVVLELTFIRFCWTFNFDYSSFLLAGVIWMLGCCMILLSALVSLKPKVVGIIGLCIILLQSLFAYVPQTLPIAMRIPFGKFWEFIYPSGLEAPHNVTVLYVLVPWIGVMAVGYGFGTIFSMDSAKRNKICLWVGLSAIAIFLAVGSVVVLMQPKTAETPAFIFALLNQRKYPASPLFLCMTLGPAIALIPFAEKAKGWFAKMLTVFGRVPLFYYLLHIPLIHLSALLVNLIRNGMINSEWYANAPYTWIPEENRWALPLLYLVFILNVTILYFVCRWYSQYKSAHPEKQWLKYI